MDGLASISKGTGVQILFCFKKGLTWSINTEEMLYHEFEKSEKCYITSSKKVRNVIAGVEHKMKMLYHKFKHSKCYTCVVKMLYEGVRVYCNVIHKSSFVLYFAKYNTNKTPFMKYNNCLRQL